MGSSEAVNLTLVPLVALRTKTRCLLSQMLNASKVIPSCCGLPRDWRGLAHIASVTLPVLNNCDPTSAVLEEWIRSSASFQDLVEAFKELDRWDVLYDLSALIESDANVYVNAKDRGQKVQLTSPDIDQLVLTVDDISLAQRGDELQLFDAFLLYSDADSEFAMQVVNKLENEFGLKLCLKDRDLIAGVNFEHEAIMKLISQRCNRLIIIVSPSFLESPANSFFVTFAQALGIEKGQRKIIPLIYKRLASLPRQLSYYHVLDYTRRSQIWDFWKILMKSVIALPEGTHTSNHSSICIKELNSNDEEQNKLSLAMARPEHWDSPIKTGGEEILRSEPCILAEARKTPGSSKAKLEGTSSKNHSSSIFSRVLPKSLKEKSRSKKLKKKALLAG